MRSRGIATALAVLGLAAPARADESEDQRALAPLAAQVLAASTAALDASRAAVFPSQGAVGVTVSGDASEALTRALSRALREALAAGGQGAVEVPAGADDEALARAARDLGAQRVLRVRLAREAAGLTATTDALRARASAWETFLRDEPPAVAHAGAAVALRLDAALRARFGLSSRAPWPAAGVVRPRTIPTPFRGVVALAVGALGDPAVPAIAVATTDALRVARVEARTLAFLPTTWPLSPLGAVASPPRQPLGAMTWDAAGIRVRTSAQAQMGALAREGSSLARTLSPAGDRWPVGAGAARVDALSARVLGEGADPAMRAAFPAAWTGAAGTVTVACDGAGACVVRLGAETLATLRDTAPPVLIDDLDEDGAPEVVTASASAQDAPDRVRVFSLSGRTLTERAGIAAPGPVLALASGEGAAGRVLVAAALDPARGAATLMIVP